ncbi:Mitofilin domain-containing protein [Cephalotus follicularis]|uniref:Mitofilin domain-containing protein n=1 Tax=Cephalotus follicularis TaxID=3775 RepID=A0A1Q3BKF8_CEPFO|nr:Mitofilin domain-containing protein [Cephalotus follicularis]
MLRSSVLQLSSRRSVARVPKQIEAQTPSFLSSRKDFATVPQQNARPMPPGSGGNSTESKGHSLKIILGSGAVAGAFLFAYQIGYLDPYLGKKQHRPLDTTKGNLDDNVAKDAQHIVEPIVTTIREEPDSLRFSVEHAEKADTQTDLPHVATEQKVETHTDVLHTETIIKKQDENLPHVQEKSDVFHEEGTISVQQKDLPENAPSGMLADDQSSESESSVAESAEKESPESETSRKLNEEVQLTPIHTQAIAVLKENETKVKPPEIPTPEHKPEDAAGKGVKAPSSLLDTYNLKEGSTAASLNGQGTGDQNHFLKETEAFVNAVEDLHDANMSKDGKLVLDFLEAIHIAEKRQAELDARAFAEEKRALKDKYEKELRDLRARELMRIEEVAILDKELNRERTKAVAAIKSLQEKMEEKHRTELEKKESETEFKLQKVQELAKAELAAAIASEKAAQIKKVAEANLNINALCMAFYARSEEARKSHSVRKLALGALALEDALSKGLPIQKEIGALHTYLEDIDKDSVLDSVLSSLPEETRSYGTDTLLQLNQKFNALKGTLQHFGLIPPGGGGILTHAVAHIASWLKFKDVDQSGDGVESVINRVEGFLALGKLAEAADALEEGIKGSQAEEVVGEWVKRARNRAITEQALTLLESYATCISVT